MFSSHREVLLLYDHRLPMDPHQVHGRALHHLRIHSLENSFLWTIIPKFLTSSSSICGFITYIDNWTITVKYNFFVSCSSFTSFVLFQHLNLVDLLVSCRCLFAPPVKYLKRGNPNVTQ